MVTIDGFAAKGLDSYINNEKENSVMDVKRTEKE